MLNLLTLWASYEEKKIIIRKLSFHMIFYFIFYISMPIVSRNASGEEIDKYKEKETIKKSDESDLTALY